MRCCDLAGVHAACLVVCSTAYRPHTSLNPHIGANACREVSKVLIKYGTAVLQLTTVSNAYEQKYKGVWICLLMLARAMSGNYVNFGVFELYGDPALKVSGCMRSQLSLAHESGEF